MESILQFISPFTIISSFVLFWYCYYTFKKIIARKKIITERLYYYFSNIMKMCCFNCHFVIYIIFIVVYLPLILSFTMIFSEP